MRSRAAPEIDTLFAALADPVRRRAIDRLSRGPLRSSDLASELDLTPPAMSRHLRVLRDAGLVSETHTEVDGRVRVYAINSERLSDLRTWLEKAEAGWSEQLTSFKRHVERKL